MVVRSSASPGSVTGHQVAVFVSYLYRTRVEMSELGDRREIEISLNRRY